MAVLLRQRLTGSRHSNHQYWLEQMLSIYCKKASKAACHEWLLLAEPV
jgi:hypothetical protein